MSLLQNLRSGLRLATWYRVPASDFDSSLEQLIGLMLVQLGLALSFSWAVAEAPRSLEWYAIYDHALFLVVGQSFAYVMAREVGQPWRTRRVAVMLLATSPALWIFCTLFAVLARDLAHPVVAELANQTICAVAVLWAAWVGYRAARIGTDLSSPRSFAITAVYAVAVATFAWHFPADQFWQTDHWSQWQEENEEAEPDIDHEALYYSQFGLVESVNEELQAQRPGLTDLYFLSFGAWAKQDVFMREALFTRDLFDRRFDTAGRSATLINNPKSMDETPLASVSNLSLVLRQMGSVMDPEEDVLFLFLSSHGSKSHELAVRFEPLELNPLDPARLSQLLDEAGIKWRVIVVSACYSGGFIEPLRDPHSLIMTAAAADRNSFGCSDEADFTYFGRAYFDEQLTSEFSFVRAFENARDRIVAWEQEEGKKASNPQMVSDAPILEKLADLEARLLKDAEASLAAAH